MKAWPASAVQLKLNNSIQEALDKKTLRAVIAFELQLPKSDVRLNIGSSSTGANAMYAWNKILTK